jgi:isopentenyl-diphosphate delta-isomerase
VPNGSTRKADHIRIATEAGVEHERPTGLEAIRLRHRALPERDLADVSLDTTFLGFDLEAPLLISAMTGGTAEAAAINQDLARAACEQGIGLVLGSGRRLLEDRDLLGTYRSNDRPRLLLANLGAAQLRAGGGLEDAVRLVALLEADGLTIHLNPLQEAIQPEGQPLFSGIAERIATLVERLAPLPVVVKEVGFGLDATDVEALRDAGAAAVDVAGAGGTNWALIEGRRDSDAAQVAAAFGDWGTPTAEALLAAVRAAPGLPVIASGGVRHGVDAAKCLALGAAVVGLARPLLIAAADRRASEVTDVLVRQLRIAVWATGAKTAAELDGAVGRRGAAHGHPAD